MSFFSISFVVLIFITFLLYWWAKNIVIRNLIIIIACLCFYSTCGLPGLIILISLLLTTFFIGNIIIDDRPIKKFALYVGLIVNLGALLTFKYCNFFIENVQYVLSLFDIRYNHLVLKLVIPAGLSFYVFMLVGHLIDCYRKIITTKPTLHAFTAYIVFFPHLFAGPIDKSRNVLPQFESDRVFTFDKGREGCWQILNGLFKKIVVADLCAVSIDSVWQDIGVQSSLSLIIAAILYSIRIYCDFSGFSDIALGLGKLFGFNLTKNFNYPYFARNISEFWRRWHISLTSWLTEYIYIPLGGNRHGIMRTLTNTIIVFAICGFWHGANWSYILWGLLCGLMFVPYLLQKNPVKYKVNNFNMTPRSCIAMVFTFVCITFSWVIFCGAEYPLSFTISYFKQMLDGGYSIGTIPYLRLSLFFSIVIIVVEWRYRRFEFALMCLKHIRRPFRWITYLVLCVMISLIYLILPLEDSADTFIYQNF